MDVDLPMTAPAFSPTDGTDGTADPIAFNTVGTSGRWVQGQQHGYTLVTEPPRVGVALATGSVAIVKHVNGPADGFAPDSFDVTLQCTSAGQDVPLGDAGTLTLSPDQPVTIDDLPWGATCTATETGAGQISADRQDGGR
jgi:hypothetical protein